MLKTGGGSAILCSNGDFGFSQKQIGGLYNQFDDDSTSTSTSFPMEESNVITDNSIVSDTTPINQTPEQLPKFSNKKMKMGIENDEYTELKKERLRLDNIHKQKITEHEKTKMAVTTLMTRKLELEIKKLQLEIKKLERETKEQVF